jgi:phage terminase large subunit-like protein
VSPFTLTAREKALYHDHEVPKADWGKPSGAVIAFAHALTVPSGPFTNQPLRLRKFQIEWIRAIYNPLNADGFRPVKQAILSVARRNGKTLLAAVLVLVHLVGPFKRPNATIVSAATTRKQAGVVFRYVEDMVRVDPVLSGLIKVNPSTKHMVHREDGSYYEAISAEAGAHFGMGLDLAIYDELAHAKNRALYDTLMTSLGSQKEALMAIISTQAPSDAHLLSELIDYGKKVNCGTIDDPSFVCHLHTVPIEAPLLDEKQWKKANPGLDDYRDLAEMRQALTRAHRIPSLESSARVYYLNQRVRADQPFLSPGTWEANKGMIDETLFTDGRPVFGGLDLSARTDLTAMVLATEDDAHDVHLKAFAWTPKETIEARALRDRAPYDAWERQGFIFAPPGAAIDYDFVAADIVRLTQGMNLVKLAYDRWRIEIIRQALARMGTILPLDPFGQGFKEMSPAIEAFEELALAQRLRHGGHPVLRWCLANTVISRDPAGNRKPDKSKYYGRIDLAVAAVMAIGAMKTQAPPIDVAAMIA